MAKTASTARRHLRASSQQWADLADLVLIIAREIQVRGYDDPRAVSLTQQEGAVMRYLAEVATATPSQIATGTGLQRTNVSAALRSLEAKGLIERTLAPQDGRAILVHRTRLGASNYELVRQEWATTVAAAASGDAANLDLVLALLRSVGVGLARSRLTPGRKK